MLVNNSEEILKLSNYIWYNLEKNLHDIVSNTGKDYYNIYNHNISENGLMLTERIDYKEYGVYMYPSNRYGDCLMDTLNNPIILFNQVINYDYDLVKDYSYSTCTKINIIPTPSFINFINHVSSNKIEKCNNFLKLLGFNILKQLESVEKMDIGSFLVLYTFDKNGKIELFDFRKMYIEYNRLVGVSKNKFKFKTDNEFLKRLFK